jgi:hypothetical protein
MLLLGRRKISRRTLLRGAGVAMSLPLLEAMMGRSHAAPVVRLLVYFWPHGTSQKAWPLAKTGNITAADLSPATQVFKPGPGAIDLVPHLTFVSGVGDLHGHAGASHQCSMMATAEGDRDPRGDSGTLPLLPSIDQVCAMRLGAATALPSLSVSAASNPGFNVARTVLSWRGPNQPVTPYLRPAKIFQLLFGMAPAGDQLRARDKSVLDVVAADAKRLRARLGKIDQRRMDDYDQSVREIERSLQGMGSSTSAACTSPDASAWGGDTAQAGIEAGPVEGMLLKLIVLAFRCDRTRYASYLLEYPLGAKRWSAQGSPMGDHDLSHDSNGTNPAVVSRTNMKLSYLAAALREMASIDEGGSTLLDNTLVYSNSDNLDGNGHTRKDNQPIILAGHAGGRLRGGQHLQFTPARPLNDLLASVLTHVGVPTERWGKMGGGTLPGL